MKNIDKTRFIAPASYISELKTAQLDESSIVNGANNGLSGKELFDLVKGLNSYPAMKCRLFQDQGYVCCYCNRSIPARNVPTEHVQPKSVHRELVGEYKNLLVACNGGSHVPSHLRQTYPLHCDQAKREQEIPISPLTNRCEYLFKYDPISGLIGGDPDVMRTVTILNLNHSVLKKERKDEINIWCYDKNGHILSDEQLYIVFSKMLELDVNGHYHNLYYVIASAAIDLSSK